MGGLQCAKTIIDNGRLNAQIAAQHFAGVERAIGCMSNSILLSAGKAAPVYPTEEQEADFLAATAAYQKACAAAAEPLLAVANRIAMRCDPTKGAPTVGLAIGPDEPG